MNTLQHNFYNAINKLFDNKLPDHVTSIKIEASLDEPVTITVKYIPDIISGDPLEVKYGLIEHPYESNKQYDG